jgi:large subunit ribosomal protein L1
MAVLSKRAKAIRELLTPGKIYALPEAIALIQKMPKPKFNETIDIAVNLGVDPRKSDQNVRGAVVLPHGTGRSVRVAVMTSAAHQEAATKAGADLVGLEDIAEQIKGGKIDFDILLVTPDAMKVVGQLGQILGPRGLMPNPKDGTVTMDIANAVKNAKHGQVGYRTDKAGIVHCPVGKVDFSSEKLSENIQAVMVALRKIKPSTSKGVYIKKITLSATMGPGVLVDTSAFVN